MMNASLHPPVVAGIDGTEAGRTAARYAAWEASRRQVGLRLVFAFQPTPLWGPATVITDDDIWEQPWVRDLLSGTAKEIAAEYPHLPIDAVAVSGSPAGALVTESHRAGLVVVGTKASPGIRGRIAGSVAAQVAAYSRGPVLVTRVEPDAAGSSTAPVMVGLDGSPQSLHAMSAAVDEALARGTSVHAVYVWDEDRIDEMSAAPAETLQLEWDPDKAERLLTEATAGWSDRYPDLKITRECVRGTDVVDALCGATVAAGLLVVGSRGRGGFLGLRLGSTVDALVRRVAVPLLVIHADGVDR
jgi:nucleotide-binding universal stress UspA family protein